MKNITPISFSVLILLMMSSCVSSKIHDDLKDKYDDLRDENRSLMEQIDSAGTTNDQLTVNQLRAEIDQLKKVNTQLSMDLTASKNNLERLKESYDALEANSSSVLTENMERNRKLLKELEAKEETLAAEEARLSRLQKKLEDRSKRVEELEGIIASKDANMRSLKDAISTALTNFEGNGLTVEQRDGKVYVSMENKLLFESGSWSVNARGKEAVVALGKVLAKNKEIAVLIEGHTDNVPFGGSGNIKNNWDLSTKRATAIVAILVQNNGISKENLTAAGRGEHAPIEPNSTKEGRSKNRRIEVVLTPKLDEINKLLNGIK